MTRRDLPPPRDQVLPRSLPLGSIWSKITSDIGGILTNGAAPTTSPTTGDVSPAIVNTVMTTEVFTTVWRTSLVTVRLTTDVVETHTPNQPHHTGPVTSDDGSTTIPSSVPTPIGTTTQHSLSLPTGLGTSSGASSGPSTSSITFASKRPAASATAAAGATASHSKTHQKHAIIGGLSGAIAGLILIGVLIVFFLRRRRKLNDDDRDSTSEKGIRPAVARKWSQLTKRDIPPRPFLPASRDTATPDIDGGLIHLSLDRWPRPYAHGESYRESMGPRRLQVMNPSPSRPSTPLPRGSSESITSFLTRHKSVLAAVITGRPRGDSTGESPQRSMQIPTIAIDPALSTECVVLNAPTPSFRSYSSVSSTPMVEQRPPEDPFLTPPDERAEDEHIAAQAASRRPGIGPLQNAAGAASRTLSHLGNALNPFRSKSHVAESVRSSSRRSVSTFSSGGDPFQLDRPSPYQERRAGEIEREEKSNWNLYEGT